MARAAVKAKQQAKKANVAPQRARQQRGRRKHAGGGNPNQQLFFIRMRRSAKPVYVLLAVLFAATFAILGVGSGQNSGLDQIFSGLNPFHHSGTSVSSAQKYVAKHPNDPKGFRDLATAYEAKSDTSGAINALQEYTNIKRKDVKAWTELGNLQLQQAQSYATQYQAAYEARQLAAPSTPFLPTGKLGTAIGTNQIEQTSASQVDSQLQSLQSQVQLGYTNAVSSYQRAANLQPGNSNNWFTLAQAAQQSGDVKTAVKAYKKFLALNPDSTSASQIKALIKQLSPAPAPASKKKK
jgi:tetratricopeptide (TPR) repeat protein